MKNRSVKASVFNGKYTILASKLTRRMLKYYFIVYVCLMLILCLSLFPALYFVAKQQTESAALQLRNILADRQRSTLKYADVLAAQTNLGKLLEAWHRDPCQKNKALLELYLHHYVSDYEDLLMVIVDDHAGGIFKSLAYYSTGMAERILEDKTYVSLSSDTTGTIYFPVSFDLLYGLDSSQSSRASIAVAKNYEIENEIYTISLYCKANTVLASASLIEDQFFDYWWIQQKERIFYSSQVITEECIIRDIDQNTASSGWQLRKSGYVCYNTIIDSGWVVAGYVTISKLMSNYVLIVRIVMLLYVLSPILYSAFLVGTVNRVLSPLKKLSDAIAACAADGTSQVNIHSGDELEHLGNSFNHMMLELNMHFEEVKKFERENAVSQFRLLNTQIDPHFIYNTMNIISLLARQGETEAVVEVNSTLIQILQQRLNSKNSIFDTVEAELQTMRQYQFIMDYRYANNVAIHYDIDESVRDVLILKNILQPLVENAYFHGLSQEDGNINGNIIISVHRCGEEIILAVNDDGRGMSSKRLEQISSNSIPIEKGKRIHIGLCNIQQRLKLVYGVKQTMKIISGPSEGTSVRITFPEKMNPDDEIWLD